MVHPDKKALSEYLIHLCESKEKDGFSSSIVCSKDGTEMPLQSISYNIPILALSHSSLFYQLDNEMLFWGIFWS